MIPGEIKCYGDTIKCNVDRSLVKIAVINTGDRPIQVGSHYHFFEVNRELSFDRDASYGYRLNIPAGSAVRFEPHDEKTVELVELAGSKEVYGLNNQTNGRIE